MKRLCILLLSCGALAGAADLAGVRAIYILPMRGGLDQYLANRLSNSGLFHVVTDPKLADTVMTDHIGESLQSQLDDFNPKPAAPAPAPAPPPKDSSKPGIPVDTDTNAHKLPQTSSFARSHGTIFLVDQKSRQVVWSVYDQPKGSEAKELDRTASDIVSRIKKDLAPPPAK